MAAPSGQGRVFYGWYIVGGGWGVHVVVASTYVLGMGVLFNPIREEMGWTAAATALAFSLRQFEGGVLSPVVGFLIDRLGTRKMMLGGLALMGLSFILLGRIHSLWEFYAVFLLLALGVSLGYSQAMNAAVVNWFHRQRVRAMGLMWTGGSIGGLLVPGIAFMVGATGWRTTTLVCGIAVLALCLPLAALMRHRPEPYGLAPDGDAPAPAVAGGQVAAGRAAASTAASSMGVLEAARTRSFWVIALAQAAFSMVSTMVLTVNLVPFLESIQVPRAQASTVITVFMLAALPARLFLSWFGDRFQKRKLLALLYGMSAAGTLVLAASQSYLHTIPFALLAGFAHGGVVILTAALVGECFGTHRFGSINGLLHTFAVVGGVVGPFAAAMVFDLLGTYRPAFLVVAVLMALVAPTILMARQPRAMAPPEPAPARTV